MLSIDILTLFPEMVASPLTASVLGKARERGVVRIDVHDIRDWADGKHRVADDLPFGGGAGMVMKPEPVVAAIGAARARLPGAGVYLLTPRGRRFDQAYARELVRQAAVVLVCGRYEGVDERVCAFCDGQISVGDFVLSGGEFAALCVVDAVARLEPGVMGNAASGEAESFEQGLLEYAQYTRPRNYRGMAVPEVLLSGNHERVRRFRRREALLATRERRPDLFAKHALTEEDTSLLAGDEP